MEAKFCIFKSLVDGDYYYHLQAENGEKILGGEGYSTKQACRDGITSVKLNARDLLRYELRSSYMNYRFNLRAANGEIIGRSEGYVTIAGRDNGIAAVKRLAPVALVVDRSVMRV